MQSVSSLYQSIADSHDYHVESALVVCDNSILPSSDYTDSTHKELASYYDEEVLWSISTTRNAFSSNVPEVGCCTCGEIDVQMLKPSVLIPTMARITPYVRLVPNGTEYNDGYGNYLTDASDYTISWRTQTGSKTYTFSNSFEFVKGASFIVSYDYVGSDIGTTNPIFEVRHMVNGVACEEDGSVIRIVNSGTGHFTCVMTLTDQQLSGNTFTISCRQLGFPLGRCSYQVKNLKVYNTAPSEWIRKGVYFIDSRNVTKNDDDLNILTLHGYDAMLKAEDNYPSTSQASPTDIQAVNEIATAIGVEVDPRTTAIINKGYTVTGAIGFTMREVLGHVASAYGGNFIINDLGMLQLICLWDLPEETNLLSDEHYNAIAFGTGANYTRIDLGEED